MQFSKIVRYVAGLLLTGAILLLPLIEGQAAVPRVVDLLLQETADLEGLQEELLRADKTLSVEVIPEIQLLRVTTTSQTLAEEFARREMVEMAGRLADVTAEDQRLSAQKGLLKGAVIPETVLPGATADDLEILEQLAWYKETMLAKTQLPPQTAGSGIKIALIDSGVDVVHPLLSPVLDLTTAQSFVTSEPTINDSNGHGTMVAGVLAQMAPAAKITPYKVISESDGESFWVLEAMIQAVNDGQDILNMSLGTYKYADREDEAITIKAFERAVAYALQAQVVVVSSAGNLGLDLDLAYSDNQLRHLPGAVTGVLTVSALTQENKLASYSNSGSNVQYAAPGGDYIYSDGFLDLSQLFYTTYPTDRDNLLSELGIPQGYMFTAGTSLAAPCVSGVAADYLAYYRKMTGTTPTVGQLQQDLAASSLDLGVKGKDPLYGYGLPVLGTALPAVPDKLPPTGEFVAQTLEVNEVQLAAFFTANVTDNSQKAVAIAYSKQPDFSRTGRQEIQISLTDSSGNQRLLTGEAVVKDTVAPTGTLLVMPLEVNEAKEAVELVSDVADNSAGEVKISYVHQPDFSKLGQQEIAVRLMDAAGNERVLTSTYVVADRQAPTGVFKALKVSQGTKLSAAMFVEQLADNYYPVQQLRTAFVESVDTDRIGSCEVAVRLSDPAGNASVLSGQLEVAAAAATNESSASAPAATSESGTASQYGAGKVPTVAANTTSGGQQLPHTAEKESNMLAVGCLLLAAGSWSLIYRKGR